MHKKSIETGSFAAAREAYAESRQKSD